MKFHDWLAKQEERQDAVGRFARAFSDVDPSKYTRSRRRKPDEHFKWARIIVNRGKPGFVYIFNDAWNEFTQAKEKLEMQEA